MAGEGFQGLRFCLPTCLGSMQALLYTCGILLTSPAVRLALSLGSGYPEDGKQQSGILQFGIVPCYPALELYQRSVLPSCSFWKAKEGGVVPTHIIILHKEINWYLLSLQVSRAWSRMVVKQQSPPLPNHNHFLLAPSRPYLWGTDTLSITICPWNNVFVRAGRNTCHEWCQWYFLSISSPKAPRIPPIQIISLSLELPRLFFAQVEHALFSFATVVYWDEWGFPSQKWMNFEGRG